MKIIGASDFHTWNDDHLDSMIEFCDVVYTEKPDLLVLDGDIGDPWKDSWQNITKTKSWKALNRLCADRFVLGLRTVYIKRNHDSNASKEHLPYAEFKGNHREGEYLFMHGWEFDVSWRGLGKIWGIAPIAFWISIHASWLMLPVYRLLYGKSTPAKMKEKAIEHAIAGVTQTEANGVGMVRWGHPEDGLEKLNDWSYHVGVMHMRAMEYAIKKNVVIIMGHTHYPTNYNDQVYDCGDMIDSFSYVYIDGDEVEIRYLS